LYQCISESENTQATYDVYYWKDVASGNPNDEKYIGTTNSAASCEALAIRHAKEIRESWNYRSYICVKNINGRKIKMRYGEPE
jgi:hypothetical protein